MLRLPKPLASAELTTVSVDLYTVPSNSVTTISAFSVCNKTTTPYFVTITQTPNGGTTRNVHYQVVIPAKGTFIASGVIAQSFSAGSKISALAEANSAFDVTVAGYVTTLPSA